MQPEVKEIEMGKIVAIGGGSTAEGETEAIDRTILDLSGQSRPRVVFVPTASSDSTENWEAFDHAYRRGLGCQTDVLYLLNRDPGQDELQDKILGSDIIYVGGGNTLKMMRRWRRLGVDKLMVEAWRQGQVMCGVSAGAICWFKFGHSDSMSFYDADDWRYVSVTGLGLVNALACPHYDSDTKGVPRRADFRAMVLKRGGMAVAIDNRCALAFVDDGFRVIAENDSARAYKLYRFRGAIVETELDSRDEWRPLSALLQRD